MLVLVQYFSGAQPVVVINDAELARYVIMRHLSKAAMGMSFATACSVG